MTQRHLSLTEKEKETLRLLLQGYDAKSMAQHLGLSVHTINERLRDARRKMATSSSREAARMLREVEEHDPELLGDKTFGDATASGLTQDQSRPAQGPGTRRAGWIAGGIVMSFGLALLALSSLSGPATVPAAAPSATTAVVPTPAARPLPLRPRGNSWLWLIGMTGRPAGMLPTNRSSCSTRLNGGPMPRVRCAVKWARSGRANWRRSISRRHHRRASGKSRSRRITANTRTRPRRCRWHLKLAPGKSWPSQSTDPPAGRQLDRSELELSTDVDRLVVLAPITERCQPVALRSAANAGSYVDVARQAIRPAQIDHFL